MFLSLGFTGSSGCSIQDWSMFQPFANSLLRIRVAKLESGGLVGEILDSDWSRRGHVI